MTSLARWRPSLAHWPRGRRRCGASPAPARSVRAPLCTDGARARSGAARRRGTFARPHRDKRGRGGGGGAACVAREQEAPSGGRAGSSSRACSRAGAAAARPACRAQVCVSPRHAHRCAMRTAVRPGVTQRGPATDRRPACKVCFLQCRARRRWSRRGRPPAAPRRTRRASAWSSWRSTRRPARCARRGACLHPACRRSNTCDRFAVAHTSSAFASRGRPPAAPDSCLCGALRGAVQSRLSRSAVRRRSRVPAATQRSPRTRP